MDDILIKDWSGLHNNKVKEAHLEANGDISIIKEQVFSKTGSNCLRGQCFS